MINDEYVDTFVDRHGNIVDEEDVQELVTSSYV